METSPTTEPVREVRLDYVPREQQERLHQQMDLHRFGTIICHRRFGKTIAAINHLIVGAHRCELKRPRVAYLAPTFKRAKAIAWDYAKDYSRPLSGKANESELRIDYPGGPRLRLFGCDYPESMKGLYFDMVVADEFDEMDPKVFSEVIRPALSDRHGSFYAMGTPKGKRNLWQFFQQAQSDPEWFSAVYKQSETGIIAADEIAQIKRLIDSGMMSQAEYDQEFECSFTSAIVGAFWAKELAACRAAGRICSVPLDPSVPVETYWDLGLGVGNAMAVWFGQRCGSEVHWVDFYEAEGVGFNHFAKILAERGYTYGKHYAPHDISVREIGNGGKSRLEAAAALGLNFVPIQRVADKADSIEAVRPLLNFSYFDEQKCARGIEHLESYRRGWSEEGRVWRPAPVHDMHSNGADAFQQAAMVIPLAAPTVILNTTKSSRFVNKM